MGKSAAAKRAGNENSKRSPDEAQRNPGPHASAGPAFGDAALRAALNELGAAKPQVSYSPQDISQPAAKTVAQVLGEITWLMTQSPRHKTIQLADLEWMVMAPVLLKQFRIFDKGEQAVGVAFWALADDAVAKRIDAGDKRLAAAEWKSGPIKRIVDIVAPFGAEAEMREQVSGS
ncbi:MAG: toxin-activating lysine-acyltransferase [Pseudomonadota bacterium]